MLTAEVDIPSWNTCHSNATVCFKFQAKGRAEESPQSGHRHNKSCQTKHPSFQPQLPFELIRPQESGLLQTTWTTKASRPAVSGAKSTHKASTHAHMVCDSYFLFMSAKKKKKKRPGGSSSSLLSAPQKTILSVKSTDQGGE